MDHTENKVIEYYKHFHSHPELSFQEFETTKKIKEILPEHHIEVLNLPLATGVVAVVGKGDRTIALRADIDALPITEETDLPYKSQHQNIMHACGHDSHTSALLGTALLLKEQEDKLQGKVLLVFQPAEEAPGGAQKIIDTKVLDPIEAIFGIHSDSTSKVGTLTIRKGPTHASVERFKLIFKGIGCHAAHPNDGVDPIIAASQFVTAAQSIVSRNVHPQQACVVSITHLEAGSTWNVIPQSALLEGTIRTFDKDTRAIAKNRLVEIAKGIAATFNLTVDFSWEIEVGNTFNDEQLASFAKTVALKDNFEVQEGQPSTGGEDFALYQEFKKGLFILFGTGKSAPAHNPKFTIDVNAIYPVSKYLANLAQDYFTTQEQA